MATSELPDQKVCFQNVHGLAVVEEDIILGKVSELKKRISGRNAIARAEGSIHRWPNGNIPYRTATADTVYSDGAIDYFYEPPANYNLIVNGLSHHTTRTAVRFYPQTFEPDYVTFVHLPDDLTDEYGNPVDMKSECSSEVGMQGGEQVILLGSRCTTGNIIHEIGHTEGLYHEQSREDRNNFITTHPENIRDGFLSEFEQRIFHAQDLNPYDLLSIMHYGPFAFAKIKNASASSDEGRFLGPSITLTDGSYRNADGSYKFGQRIGLSTGDIAAINLLYSSAFLEAPDQLSVNDVTALEATLAFSDNSDNEFGFRIEIAGPIESPAPLTPTYNPLGFLPGNPGVGRTQYRVSQLQPNSLYYLRAYADRGILSARSPAISVRTLPLAIPLPQLSSLSISTDALIEGATGTGTITLTSPALPEGITVTLFSSDPHAAILPATIWIPPQSLSATFSFTAGTVSVSPSGITLSATLGGITRSASLTISRARVGEGSVLPKRSKTGYLRGIQYTMPATGRIQDLSIYHLAATRGKLVVGVYADNGNSTSAPSTLLAQSAGTPVSRTEGWQTIPLKTPTIPLEAGTKIWLVFQYSVNPGTAYNTGTGNEGVYKSRTYSATLPSRFGTPKGRFRGSWSFYGNLAL